MHAGVNVSGGIAKTVIIDTVLLPKSKVLEGAALLFEVKFAKAFSFISYLSKIDFDHVKSATKIGTLSKSDLRDSTTFSETFKSIKHIALII